MSLDIGSKNWPSIKRPKKLIVTLLKTISKNKLFLPNLIKIAQDFEIGGIIIGYPFNQKFEK